MDEFFIQEFGHHFETDQKPFSGWADNMVLAFFAQIGSQESTDNLLMIGSVLASSFLSIE